MRQTIALSIVIGAAVTLGGWPISALRVGVAKTRPEAVAAATPGRGSDARPDMLTIGGAVLLLASSLRRNLPGAPR